MGLRDSRSDTAGDATFYSYDQSNRLTNDLLQAPSVGATLATYQYTLDGADNRLAQTVNGIGTTFTYNAQHQRIVQNHCKGCRQD
jgi:hypothetical protein